MSEEISAEDNHTGTPGLQTLPWKQQREAAPDVTESILSGLLLSSATLGQGNEPAAQR